MAETPAAANSDTDRREAASFDGAWKEALTLWLPGCFQLFWPEIHHRIAWSQPPVFLDKELRSLQRLRRREVRQVDHLVELRLQNGERALLLMHLEVQAGSVGQVFLVRMFHYHVLLLKRYPDHVHLSCAILLDREQGPAMETYRPASLGSELRFRFPVVNLAAWQKRVAELEAMAPANPFAVVVLAQLQSRATRPGPGRLPAKLGLARALRSWGYGGDDRLALFRVLDGLLVLPEALDDLFFEALEQTEGEEGMERLTSIQRVYLRRVTKELAAEKLSEGASLVLQSQLRQRFGPLPDWALVRLGQADTDTLQRWALNVLQADSLEAVLDD